MTAGSFPEDLAYPLAMPTAISSWRELMYNGTPSLCAFALAKASQTGDHSDPGEAKIRSTPICESTRKRVSAPLSPSVSIMTISFFLRVPIVPDVPIVREKSRTLYQITARCCNSVSFPGKNWGFVHHEELGGHEGIRIIREIVNFVVIMSFVVGVEPVNPFPTACRRNRFFPFHPGNADRRGLGP